MNTIEKTSTPEIVYIDLNLAQLNPGVHNVGSFINRTSPILANGDEYYVSVAKLTLSTSFSIPLWQPTLNTTAGLNDGYNTIYSLSLTYLTYASTQVFIRLIPYNSTVQIPTLPLLSQPSGENYGWNNVYSYSTISHMLNRALQNAYGQLITQGAPIPSANPYFTWDPTTELFSLNTFPITLWDHHTNPNPIQLYFNNEYQPYLTGWLFTQITTAVNTPTGRDCALWVSNQGNNFQPQNIPPSFDPIDPANTALIQTQDFKAYWTFQALSSIQVVASLPFQTPELTSLPLNLTNIANNNQTSAILTDFSVDYSLGGASSFNQPITYTPTSIINSRPIKLSGKSAITNFNVSIHWVNLQGYVSPIQTIGIRNVGIKLAFVKNRIVENSS